MPHRSNPLNLQVIFYSYVNFIEIIPIFSLFVLVFL